jgi:hypothetical protein
MKLWNREREKGRASAFLTSVQPARRLLACLLLSLIQEVPHRLNRELPFAVQHQCPQNSVPVPTCRVKAFLGRGLPGRASESILTGDPEGEAEIVWNVWKGAARRGERF